MMGPMAVKLTKKESNQTGAERHKRFLTMAREVEAEENQNRFDGGVQSSTEEVAGGQIDLALNRRFPAASRQSALTYGELEKWPL
jgi:hypothetical protein